jgi:Arc/MetJ family transcription regulator
MQEQAMATEKPLTRKNLMVDAEEIDALKRALGTSTESEAVRVAVRDRLTLEETQAAFDRIRSRGGLDDVFRRSAPRRVARRAG